MSENGWTDDFLCKEWFTKSFVPQATARNTSHKPILLIYDGHGSHDTLNLIELAREHNIILFCLPPHTTHKLQPLDVGVFGPFSRAWTERCDEIVEDTGEEMPREHFVKEYMDVRCISFKESTIQMAWRKSGCWPIDRTVFKDEDYAPSISTSTSTPHVPGSFLVLLPDEPDFYDYLPDSVENEDVSSVLSSESDSDDDTQSPLPGSEGPIAIQHCEQVPTPGPTTRTSVPIDPPAFRTIPTASFYKQPDPKIPNRRGTSVHDKIHRLENDNTVLQSRVATLEAHCALALSEIQDLKRRANAKDGRARKRQKLNVDARCLTSEEGLRLAQEQQALKEAQEQKKREAQEQRAAKEADCERLRLERNPDEPFTGALTTKAKPDLQDVAQALGLLITGSKKDLLERITHHFDENPNLRNTPRYEGLFSRSRRRPARDENVTNMNEDAPTSSRSSTNNLPPLSSNIANISTARHDHMETGPLHTMFTFNAPGPSASVSFYPPLYAAHPHSFGYPTFPLDSHHLYTK